MKKQKKDPFERGMEDYQKGVFQCPYPPKSKAAEKWRNAQDYAAFREAEKAGYYDDGGVF